MSPGRIFTEPESERETFFWVARAKMVTRHKQEFFWWRATIFPQLTHNSDPWPLRLPGLFKCCEPSFAFFSFGLCELECILRYYGFVGNNIHFAWRLQKYTGIKQIYMFVWFISNIFLDFECSKLFRKNETNLFPNL